MPTILLCVVCAKGTLSASRCLCRRHVVCFALSVRGNVPSARGLLLGGIFYRSFEVGFALAVAEAVLDAFHHFVHEMSDLIQVHVLVLLASDGRDLSAEFLAAFRSQHHGCCGSDYCSAKESK